MTLRAMTAHLPPTLVAVGLLALAATVGCQEETKKRAPAKPKVTATATIPSSTNGSQTNNTTLPPGSGVPSVGAFECKKDDAKFVAECQKLSAPDNTKCTTDPIPQDLCDKAKAAAAGTANNVTGVTNPPPASSTDPNTCTVQVSSGSLNVRKSPSTTAAKVGSLGKDEKFTKTGSQGGWFKLKLPSGTEGWACDTCNGGNYIRCGSETNLWDGPDEEGTPNPDGSWG